MISSKMAPMCTLLCDSERITATASCLQSSCNISSSYFISIHSVASAQLKTAPRYICYSILFRGRDSSSTFYHTAGWVNIVWGAYNQIKLFVCDVIPDSKHEWAVAFLVFFFFSRIPIQDRNCINILEGITGKKFRQCQEVGFYLVVSTANYLN